MKTGGKIYFAKTEITQNCARGRKQRVDKLEDVCLIYPDRTNPGKGLWLALSLETSKVGWATGYSAAYSSLLVGITAALKYRAENNLDKPIGVKTNKDYLESLSLATSLTYDEQMKGILKAASMIQPGQEPRVENGTVYFGNDISVKIKENC